MITNVLEYLIASAKNYPNKIAFKDQTSSVTFLELEKKAKAIATIIKKSCGDKINLPIAVYMEKGTDSLVAFMGVLYSGNFYSPIDVHSPKKRINRIISVLKPVAVIYDKEILEGCLNIKFSDVPESCEAEFPDILDTDPCYTLFTSGSTGTPKGIAISHRSVIDYIEWLKNTFNFDENTIFGNQAPFYFDNSIFDIYSTLKNASTMVIIPETYFVFQKKLAEFMNAEKINTIFWVPSALVACVNSGFLEKYELKYVKKILFCGEVMPNKQLNVWRKKYPDALYANLYGPTEITDVCAYYIVDREFSDDEPLPIGKPCKNTGIIVLNDDNEYIKPGERGELCVRGSCLALGYYANKEKTDASFMQNPLNPYYRDLIYRTGDIVTYNERGEIIYLARKDYQIKHQGHRIELGEIETAVNAIKGVATNCALYDDKNKKIMLFASVMSDIDEKAIYQSLKEKLPTYMLPAVINILENLPLNANGKIDRVKLNEDFIK